MQHLLLCNPDLQSTTPESDSDSDADSVAEDRFDDEVPRSQTYNAGYDVEVSPPSSPNTDQESAGFQSDSLSDSDVDSLSGEYPVSEGNSQYNSDPDFTANEFNAGYEPTDGNPATPSASDVARNACSTSALDPYPVPGPLIVTKLLRQLTYCQLASGYVTVSDVRRAVSVKVIDKMKVLRDEGWTYAEREALAYRLLQMNGTSENLIVPFYGTLQNRSLLFLIFQPTSFTLGDVPTFCSLQQVKDRARSWLVQAASAIKAVHSAGIVHLDVRPENFVFDSSHDLRLTNFGSAYSNPLRQPISRHQKYESKHKTETSAYSAPEIWVEPQQFNGQADWWSYGCVAYELLSNSTIFKEPASRWQYLKVILDGGLEELDPAASDLVSGLLDFDPLARYDSETVHAHTYFLPTDKSSCLDATCPAAAVAHRTVDMQLDDGIDRARRLSAAGSEKCETYWPCSIPDEDKFATRWFSWFNLPPADLTT